VPSTPSDLDLREPTEADHEAIAAHRNRSYPWDVPMDATTVAWSIGRADPDRPKAFLLGHRAGELVGAGYVRGVPGQPGLLGEVYVGPDHRRLGIGSTIFAALLERIGPTDLSLWSYASESDAGGMGFAAHFGFVERDRAFESGLDLATFDADAHADALQAAVARGLRMSTFAAEDGAEMRQHIYALTQVLERDVPTVVERQEMTYEEWAAFAIGGPHARLDLFVLALEGDQPVALSSVLGLPGGFAYNAMTGVHRDYRGMKLGLAVKVEALRRAQAAGFTHVRTDNHQRNAPMLVINERLGYRRLPAVIELERLVPPPPIVNAAS
jgi:GNAT superfamily N-acetyltransferase